MSLFICNVAFAKSNHVSESGIGLWHIGLSYGQSKANALKDDELDSQYLRYSIEFSKTLILNNSFNVDLGIGHTTFHGNFMYKPTSVMESVPYSIKSFYLNINPIYKMTDNFHVGLYRKTFPEPVELSTTELTMGVFGANVYYNNFIFKNIRIGVYYDKADGTTSRTIQTTGVSFDIGF